MAKPVKKVAAAAKKSSKPAAKAKSVAKPVSKAKAKPVAKAKPATKPVKAAPAKPVVKKPGMVSKLVRAVIGVGKKAVTASKPAAKPIAKKAAVKTVAKAVTKPVSKPASKPASKALTKPVVVSKKPAVAKTAATKSAPAVVAAPEPKGAAVVRNVAVAKATAVAKAVALPPKIGSKKPVAAPVRKKEPNAIRGELPKGYKPSAKETYMSPLQLEYFRQKLSNWRNELVEESKQTIDNLRDEVRDVGDEAERATRETENSLELRTRDRYRKLIAKIDESLRRIDDTSYGFCIDTGDDIGLDRLEARPTAERTVDAQERWEHRQRQMGD